jgi:hypothetical protein
VYVFLSVFLCLWTLLSDLNKMMMMMMKVIGFHDILQLGGLIILLSVSITCLQKFKVQNCGSTLCVVSILVQWLFPKL